MQYKGTFVPTEALHPERQWLSFHITFEYRPAPKYYKFLQYHRIIVGVSGCIPNELIVTKTPKQSSSDETRNQPFPLRSFWKTVHLQKLTKPMDGRGICSSLLISVGSMVFHQCAFRSLPGTCRVWSLFVQFPNLILRFKKYCLIPIGRKGHLMRLEVYRW